MRNEMGGTRTQGGSGDAEGTLLRGSSGRFIRSAGESLDRAPTMPGARRVCIFAEEPYSAPCLVMSDVADECGDTYVPVVTDFRVPGWVSGDVSAVLVTGRGSSPGLVEVLEELSSRGVAVHCVAPDGPLSRSCSDRGGSCVPIPQDGDLAVAYGSILGSLAALLQSAGVLRTGDMLADALAHVRSNPDCGTDALAGMGDGFLAFYSTSDVRALAMGWRGIVGAAASRPCFSGELPEYDHNELVGWSDPNVHAPDIRMVVLRGCRGEGLVSRIVGCMLEVLEENGRDVTVVDVGDGDAVSRDVRGLAMAFVAGDAMRGAV